MNQSLGRGQQMPEQKKDCFFLSMTPNTSEFPNMFLILSCSEVSGEIQAVMQLCDLKFRVSIVP